MGPLDKQAVLGTCLYTETEKLNNLAARRWKSRHRKDRPDAAVGRGIGHGGSIQLEHLAWFGGCWTSPLVGCSRSTAIEHLRLCLLLVLQLLCESQKQQGYVP